MCLDNGVDVEEAKRLRRVAGMIAVCSGTLSIVPALSLGFRGELLWEVAISRGTMVGGVLTRDRFVGRGAVISISGLDEGLRSAILPVDATGSWARDE